MHSISEVSTNVPAFLAKLWKLVEDQDTNDLICWNDMGSGFVIHNQAQFCRELLPLYYKHNNMASFVRQLNMYGFHKKVSVEAGNLKLDKDEMEFAHPCFLKDQPYLLENIKRKIAESVRGGTKAPEVINKVLGDVTQMKGRQETLDTKLSAMKRENEALWRELAVLRQKHHKQQQIVNKLIQFLLTVVQSPGNRLGIKRRHTRLMLNDKEHDGEYHHHHHHHKHKHHRHSSEASCSGTASATITSSDFGDDELGKELSSGPTIHEIDPNAEFILPDNCDASNNEASNVTSPNEPTPRVAASLSPGICVEEDREDLDNHLESMQTDLDGLKELLSKDSCSFDASTLLSLFADDPISLGMGLPSQDEKDDDIIGSELIAYNPSLFDLTEEMAPTDSESTLLFADNAEDLVEQSSIPEISSELTTPNVEVKCPEFPEPSKKKRK